MGYSRSRARCVPLQYPSSATRGVKQALNKKSLNQNTIVLPSPFQEKANVSNKALNLLNKESTGQVLQSESGMFYELSNRKQMECEKYQDCSWFLQSPMKSGCNTKLSLAETLDPFFDAIEFDLPMHYAQPSPWGDEYLEVFTDDISLEENYRLGDKSKNYISNENFYSNYKGDEESGIDSYNINFILKKTDSIDSMKNISSTNPAEVIPISYKERLSNSNYGLTKLDELKCEIKQEVESCSESNSCALDSDDSDLIIGREEVLEEMNSIEDIQVVTKKEMEPSHEVKCEVQADKVLSEFTVDNKSNVIKITKHDENNFNPVSLPVKSELCKSNDQPTSGKFDLNLDITKLNFDQSLNVNTPDLDFMDLVDFINAEMRQENINTKTCTSTQHTNNGQNPDTNQEIHSNVIQKDIENVEPKSEKSSEHVSTMWSTNLKDNTVDFNEVTTNGVSIAERIKTSAKRRTRASVKHHINTEDEESNESMDDDEDYDFREDLLKRRCAPKKRRTKSSLSESSGDSKIIREESSSYRERRNKNNEASRRSRQNRKVRERHMYETLEEEEKKNVKLKAEADVLENQVASLRQLLLQVVLRKGGAT